MKKQPTCKSKNLERLSELLLKTTYFLLGVKKQKKTRASSRPLHTTVLY